jgi:hypothetical protein
MISKGFVGLGSSHVSAARFSFRGVSLDAFCEKYNFSDAISILISQKSRQNGTRSSTNSITQTWFAAAVSGFVPEVYAKGR